MNAAKKTRVAIGIAVSMSLASASVLQAQTAAGKKTESFGEGRIIRPDGTKIFVKWFKIEFGIDRVEYFDVRQEKQADPESLHIALNMVRSVQVRRRPTVASVARTSLLAGFAGGVVSLLASNSWGGPWKETWPEIGAATAACAAAGAVLGLTVRRYRSVYSNPDAAPRPVMKFTLGPVAPRTPGVVVALGF